MVVCPPELFLTVQMIYETMQDCHGLGTMLR